MRVSTPILVAALCATATIGAAQRAEAQQPVGALADLWSRAKSGDTIYVTDANAREVTGVLTKVSDAAVTLVVDGQLRDIAAADIREIARRGDSVWNGFWIGAALGGVMGGALGAGGCERDCAASAVAAGLIVGAEFGGIGALIDHFIPGRKVVYRAPTTSHVALAPIFSSGTRGVRLSIRFR
jgi:hypothetical protein